MAGKLKIRRHNMALQAMWVHGHSATIQLGSLGRGAGEDVGGRDWTSIIGWRIPPGVEFKCQNNSHYWFHFAIPTPVIKDGVRSHLRRVMLLFRAGPETFLQSVHVWDGGERVFVQDDLSVNGHHDGALEPGVNSFALPDREVFWGIGISVLFFFNEPGTVVLVSAGVDFEA
jgi:hypothetical protein